MKFNSRHYQKEKNKKMKKTAMRIQEILDQMNEKNKYFYEKISFKDFYWPYIMTYKNGSRWLNSGMWSVFQENDLEKFRDKLEIFSICHSQEHFHDDLKIKFISKKFEELRIKEERCDLLLASLEPKTSKRRM